MTNTSKLRPFLDRVNTWMEPGEETFINDCVNEVEEFVRESSIKDKDKEKMYDVIDEWRWTEDPGDLPQGENDKRKSELVTYLYNAVLKFEGLGVRQ